MKWTLPALLLSVLAGSAGAQTTGVSWRNDYIVAGQGSETSSCQLLSLPGGGPTEFRVSARSAGLSVFLLFSSNPCIAGVGCFDPSPCGLPPALASCGGWTNQSLDLLSAGLIPVYVGTTGVGGSYITQLEIPPGLGFSTQAVVVDALCGSATFQPPMLLTQAFTIQT